MKAKSNPFIETAKLSNLLRSDMFFADEFTKLANMNDQKEFCYQLSKFCNYHHIDWMVINLTYYYYVLQAGKLAEV